MAAMLMPQQEKLDPPSVGDKWVCVSTKGNGIPVKVIKVSALNVHFQPFGRAASQTRDMTTALNIEAFMVRYRPLDRVKNRQRELQKMERQQPSQRIPEVLAEPAAPEPLAPVMATPPDATVKPPKLHGNAKLTPDQAREIVTMIREHVPHAEIAAAYGVHKTTISKIKTGYQWGEETADLRALPPLPKPAPASPPPPTPPAPVAVAAPEPEEEPVESVSFQPAGAQPRKPTVDEARDALRRQAERPVVVAGSVAHIHPDGVALMAEMADALEFLLEYAGRPLPKYLMLDLASISKLVERARKES
jgi:hypothetical protein